MSGVLPLSVEEVEASWSRLRSDVLPQLKVSEPGWAEGPESAFHQGDSTEREILIQCLNDLGYLAEGTGGRFTDEEIGWAVAQWRVDDQASTLTCVPSNTLFSCREFMAAGEMRRLLAQVGFENETCLSEEPSLGEQSLWARIVRFRLRTFDLSDEPVALPYSVECQQRLLDLSVHLKLKKKDTLSLQVRMIQLLGDASRLSAALMKHWGRWIFVFKHDQAGLDQSIASKLETLAESNQKYLSLYTPTDKQYQRLFIACGKHRRRRSVGAQKTHAPRYFNENGFRYYTKSNPPKWVRREIEKTPSAGEAATHLINRLGLELLQLRLWMLGYYRGQVDGQWGPLSFAALQQLLTDEEAKIEKLVFPLENNYVALNLRYLFKKVLPKIDKATTSVQLADVKALEEEMRIQLKKPSDWATLQETCTKIEADEARLYRGKTRRRRYGGLRGLLAALGRSLKRFARSIVKVARAVIRGLKKLLNGALLLFRNIIRRIRKGVRLVGLAVKRFTYWLAKKPFVTGSSNSPQFVLTRFDWDGDAFHFVQEGTGPAEIRRHHRYIKRMNLAFAIVSKLAIKAIDLMASTAMGNWIMLAWDLYRLVTSSFWRDLKAMIRQYQGTFAPEELFARERPLLL